MTPLNRRDFLKTGSAALGAAVLTDLTTRVVGEGEALAQGAGGPTYEVFACKYGGTIVRSLAVSMWNTGWDEQGPINYYVWAIKGPGELILVDTGPSPAEAAARKVPNFTNSVDVLARMGAKADTVTKVVISHMHWDHVGNVDAYLKAFPRAKFYVQKRELEFAARNPVAQRKPVSILFDAAASRRLAEAAGTDRVVVLDGDATIAPGVELLLAPGHTLGLQATRVPTAKGPAIVASDLAHVFRGMKEDTGSTFVMDMPAWIQSFDKVKARAALDLIFPGHDVQMAQGYPKAFDDVTRLA